MKSNEDKPVARTSDTAIENASSRDYELEIRKHRLEVRKFYLSAVGSILVPLVVAYFGYKFTNQQVNALDIEMAKVAISILSDPERGDPALRRWAVDVLNELPAKKIHGLHSNALEEGPIKVPEQAD